MIRLACGYMVRIGTLPGLAMLLFLEVGFIPELSTEMVRYGMVRKPWTQPNVGKFWDLFAIPAFV